jgi:dienelactone hydrolase
MRFRVRGRAVLARVAVVVAAAGTMVTLVAAPGQAATAAAAGAGQVSVQTVIIPVAGQRPVIAYLVQPAGSLGPSSQAGILFLHWLGQIHSDRSEFLAEAIELAEHGAVSLLPQGIFPWVAAPHGTRRDVTSIRRQLAALQASLNYLTSRSYVNRTRVAIAGHDYGAMYGALLASTNRVVHAAVLAAPDATWGHWFVKYWLGFTGDKAAAYKAIFTGLQPVGHVARLGRHELFQWAGQDIFVSARVRQDFARHAPHARVKLYRDDDHQLTDQAQADRDAFLTRELGLS